jgi:hypothetical protein
MQKGMKTDKKSLKMAQEKATRRRRSEMKT